ncbi:hypothetical protein BC835DRAFT_1417417 [Cytidiella melzeri]|nr:hypothetical protein BC835DRAFT_1417417 [Cytidiella melzeri]
MSSNNHASNSNPAAQRGGAPPSSSAPQGSSSQAPRNGTNAPVNGSTSHTAQAGSTHVQAQARLHSSPLALRPQPAPRRQPDANSSSHRSWTPEPEVFRFSPDLRGGNSSSLRPPSSSYRVQGGHQPQQSTRQPSMHPPPTRLVPAQRIEGGFGWRTPPEQATPQSQSQSQSHSQSTSSGLSLQLRGRGGNPHSASQRGHGSSSPYPRH